MAVWFARGISEVFVDETRSVVFTPNDAVRLALETIRERRDVKRIGVRTGIPTLDDYLLPARPGELITVLGNSSNYKSGFLQWWARYAASELVSEELTNQCVIYVTWEQAIEEVLAFDMASTASMSVVDILSGQLSDDEVQRLEEVVGPRRATLPLYLVGHSVSEGRKRPALTLDVVGRALNLIRREFELTPRMILLDYLQIIEPGRGEDRRMQVFHNVHRCKDMALAMSCPVVLASQARRSVMEKRIAVPGIADSEESSNAEHASDKMLGLWMPKTKYAVGEEVPIGKDRDIEVSESLLLVRVLKQRMGPAGRLFDLYVDPATNYIGPRDDKEVFFEGTEPIPF